MIEQFLNEIAVENGLKLPEMETKVQSEPQVVVQLSAEELDHRLTNFVRSEYMDFVKNILKENYESWLKSDVGSCSGLKVSSSKKF